jgi:uncharacterized protein YegL
MESNECTNGERRIDTAKRAIRGFFDALPVDSNVGLIIFDNFGTRDAFSLQPRDSERLKALTDKAIHGGGTPLGATLAYAHEMLTLQGIKQQGYGDYNIVVLTDGEAGDKRAMIKTVNTITQTSPINIHTIGFCLGNQHALNRQGVVNYQPANNAQELIAGLNSVLAEAPSFSTSSFSELDKTGN